MNLSAFGIFYTSSRYPSAVESSQLFHLHDLRLVLIEGEDSNREDTNSVRSLLAVQLDDKQLSLRFYPEQVLRSELLEVSLLCRDLFVLPSDSHHLISAGSACLSVSCRGRREIAVTCRQHLKAIRQDPFCC